MSLKRINIVSVLIPVIIMILFQIKLPGNFSYLPHIYAPLNGFIFILLLVSLVAIKLKKRMLHQRIMKLNIFLSILFLLMYILYHATTEETVFPETGAIKYIYYFILITHILLSVVTIPLVLRAYYYATIGNYKEHKKMTRIAFPLWLYVAFSGVMVYLIISPYYIAS